MNVGRIYDRVCEEWESFDKEFAPTELHLNRLFELSFFVGAASGPGGTKDDALMDRITSIYSLVQWDRQQFRKSHDKEIW